MQVLTEADHPGILRVDQNRRPALAAALLGLALYAVSIGGTYVYDDAMIRDDPRQHLPWGWLKFATESYNGGIDNLYRPLVSWSFALQFRVTGASPMAMHLVNVLMHAGVCALVAELARRLTNTRTAYLAGLLFAAHPIHVEAVANLVGRAEEMCAIGVLGALVLLLHRPITTGRALATAGCLVLAILSKEQGMLLPALVVIMVVALRWTDRGQSFWNGRTGLVERASRLFIVGPPPTDERERRAAQLLMMLLFWLTAAYMVFRERVLKFWWDRSMLDWTIQPMIRSGPLDRALMPLVLLGRYVALLIAPFRLSPDYGGRVIGWVVRSSDPYLYLGAAAAIAYVAAVVISALKRKGSLLFCLLSAGALYGVIGNIVTLIGTNFGERLMYLPSAFLAIVVAMAASRLSRPVLVALGTVVLSLASIRTATYSARWNDRLRFYEISSVQQPQSVRLHMLVASETLALGQLDDAKEAARTGRESLPDYAETWIQSAEVAMDRGEFDEAERFLDTAEKLRPSEKVHFWRQRVEEKRKAAGSLR